MHDNYFTNELSQKFKEVQTNIRKLKDAGLYNEALGVINSISQSSFGFDVYVTMSIPEEDLMVLLEEHRQLNHFQLHILAELLMLEGEIYFKVLSYTDSKICYEKALKILLHIDANKEKTVSLDIMDRMNKNMEMIQRIKTEMKK